MKKIAGLVALSLLLCSTSYAQFRNQVSQPSVDHSLFRSNEGGGLLLGLFNPANFSMRQSVSMSYMTMGREGMSLAMYTNSMSYRISQPLTLSADVSVMNSPFNSFGKNFTNSINGIYLTRADLNYHPSQNFQVDLQFNQDPLYRYNPYYGYYNPWGYYAFPR